MTMASRNDRDSGCEIQKSVAVDVLDNGAFTVMNNQRIAPGVRRRYYSGVALNDGARPRAWQLREDAWKLHSATSRLSVCGRGRFLTWQLLENTERFAQRPVEIVSPDRLRQVGVHAIGETAFHIPVQRMSGQS